MNAHAEYMTLAKASQEAFRISERTYATIGRLYAQGKPVPETLVALAAERQQVWAKLSAEAEAFHRAHFPSEAA